jgi:3-phenylpropionate/trans-cinnamate dioxygenase ferredoxin reductase component
VAHYKYLIIGTGMTADSATRGIREVDPSGSIALIGDDLDPPYDRPPLTKGLWKGKPFDSVWRKAAESNVELFLGRTVRTADLKNMEVVDDQGRRYDCEKLLFATGGSPRRLAFGGENILYYRTLADYCRLRMLIEHRRHFAVIGGGFIGSEIAAALAMSGRKVTMLFPGEGIGARVYPHDLSQYLNGYFRDKGVEIATNVNVTDLEERGGLYVLKSDKGPEFPVDGVIAGLGIVPNMGLAQAAGLQTANGIVVDEFLCTSHPDVFAAGDVAEFNNPSLGKRIRVEHEDNANTMGRQAGRNMAGMKEPYSHLPFFYSDLFELGYEAVGELDSRLETYVDWTEPYKKGVIYYLSGGRVRGVLLWNVWDTVAKARALINEPGPFKPADLKGRLP